MSKNNNYSQSVTVILNTKGGVGKSTASLQVITPFLYQQINGNNITDINDTQTKVRIYDIDAKNNSSEILGNSKLFESFLVKKCDLSLEKILNDEINSLSRDYPLVFDIGNTFTEDFLKVLSNMFTISDKTINFIVPVKQDEDDARNAKNTIELVKQYHKNANISIACSDSIANPNDYEDLAMEFEMIFENYYNYNEKKFLPGLFEKLSLNNKYFVVKKTIGVGNLLVRSKVWTRKTIFENAIEAAQMKRNRASHPDVIAYNEARKKAIEFYKKDKNSKEGKVEEQKSLILASLMNIKNHCDNYRLEYLNTTFQQIEDNDIIV